MWDFWGGWRERVLADLHRERESLLETVDAQALKIQRLQKALRAINTEACDVLLSGDLTP